MTFDTPATRNTKLSCKYGAFLEDEKRFGFVTDPLLTLPFQHQKAGDPVTP